MQTQSSFFACCDKKFPKELFPFKTIRLGQKEFLHNVKRVIKEKKHLIAHALTEDERFKWQNYAKCFPKDFKITITEMPEKYFKRFFARKWTLLY